jgi:zinc D-Ala-D-Ala carboxypeptidase
MMTKSKVKPTKTEEKKKSYFSEKELKCKHTGEYFFDEGFLELLNEIREECGFALPVSSACRAPSHPIESRKTATGAHQTGKAVDILVRGEKAIKLIEIALSKGITRIGVAQSGGSRFIHLDVCKKEDMVDNPNFSEYAIWSY